MKKTIFLSLFSLFLFSSASYAEGFEWRKLYAGAGFGSASISGTDDSASALQMMLGYPISKPKGLFDKTDYELAIELGYIDVSDNDRDGLWLTPTATYYMGGNVGFMLRAGYESGNDSGFIGGLGAEYRVDSNTHTRIEWVERRESTAIFLNVVFRP